MNATPLSAAQCRRIAEAADCAYDDIRWALGDHPDLRRMLHTLALEIYRAAYAEGLRAGEAL